MAENTEKSKFQALVRLADDPDNKLYNQIRNELFELDRDTTILQLENSVPELTNELQKNRLTEVLAQLKLAKLKADIGTWVVTESDNLRKGLFHIAEYGTPGFNKHEVSDLLNKITEKVNHLAEGKSIEAKIHTLNQVILYDFGFSGSHENYNDSDNAFINKVFSSKLSNPIGLSVIYLMVAEHLNLPLVGINSPGHFLLGVAPNENTEITSIEEVLFFLDPFNNGKVIAKHDFFAWLDERELPEELRLKLLASNEDIIKRIFNNLIYALIKSGEKDTVLNLLNLSENIL